MNLSPREWVNVVCNVLVIIGVAVFVWGKIFSNKDARYQPSTCNIDVQPINHDATNGITGSAWVSNDCTDEVSFVIVNTASDYALVYQFDSNTGELTATQVNDPSR